MKKLFFMVIVFFLMILCCKQHAQPIKWEKPGDELVGEWVWTKGTIFYPDHTSEETEYGAFTGNPILKMAAIAIFKADGTAQMITEFPRKTTTSKGTWSVNGDTLKVIFDKDRRIALSQYKVKGDKLIVDRLKKPKTIEEYTRE